MSERKTCKRPDCPLTRAADVFSALPEGAKPELCWQHQPREIRSLERQKRKAAYAAWHLATQPWRLDYWDRLEEQ